MNKTLIVYLTILIFITSIFSGCISIENNNSNSQNEYYDNSEDKQLFLGSWQLTEDNQSTDILYTFFSNDTFVKETHFLNSTGHITDTNQTLHGFNLSNNIIYITTNISSFQVYSTYDYNFSNDNNTLILTKFPPDLDIIELYPFGEDYIELSRI